MGGRGDHSSRGGVGAKGLWLERIKHFWETERRFTWQECRAGSLASSYLVVLGSVGRTEATGVLPLWEGLWLVTGPQAKGRSLGSVVHWFPQASFCLIPVQEVEKLCNTFSRLPDSSNSGCEAGPVNFRCRCTRLGQGNSGRSLLPPFEALFWC